MTVSLAVGYATARVLGVPTMPGMVVGGMMGLMSAFVVAENTSLRLARAPRPTTARSARRLRWALEADVRSPADTAPAHSGNCLFGSI